VCFVLLEACCSADGSDIRKGALAGVDLTPAADALDAPGPLLPSVALRRLEPPADVLQATPDAPPYYLCLSADNRCYIAAPSPPALHMTSSALLSDDTIGWNRRAESYCAIQFYP
jgi:hypothetical protein